MRTCADCGLPPEQESGGMLRVGGLMYCLSCVAGEYFKTQGRQRIRLDWDDD